MALLYTPQGVEQRGYRLTVTAAAGVSVVFKTAFSNIRLVGGDYDLSVHGYDSLTEDTKTEIFCRTIKTSTGFNLWPDADCAYITWSAEPLTEDLSDTSIPSIGTSVPAGLKPQSGMFTSNIDAANASAVFTDAYPSINYNAVVRAYLAADQTVAVPITSITKLTTGLVIAVPVDGTVVEWYVLPRTQ
jgi:hypothetical protein